MSGETDLILDELNPPQREAVVHDDGPLLIVTGAGAGKTRVLAGTFVAWLVVAAEWMLR